MAYIRSLRGTQQSWRGQFVPGSLACAAARPLSLSPSVHRSALVLKIDKALNVVSPGTMPETAVYPADLQG